MLLEALLAILIFSLGILTVIGIQATSIKMSADAGLRTKAALLANRLVGQMWASDSSIDDMKTAFESPDGDSYKAWLEDFCGRDDDPRQQDLPGVPCDSGDGEKPDPCPGALVLCASGDEEDCQNEPAALSMSTLPRVCVNKVDQTESGQVEITLYWKTPSMLAGERHRYTIVSQISRNQ
jgi:Tfp pilus assembly protein PilV